VTEGSTGAGHALKTLDAELASDLTSALSAPVEAGRALPNGAFHDPALLDLEVARLFRRDWVLVCREREVPSAGSYRAVTVGGEPVVVVRQEDGSIACLSNVCRHRGTAILEGFGRRQRLECPYHAWTYGLDGRHLGAPFVGDVVIDREHHSLPHYRVECWGGFVFVNLDDTAEPLAGRLADLGALTAPYEDARFEPYLRSTGADFEVDANWKLVYENAIESYHLFKVHPKTLNDVAPTKGFRFVAGSTRWAVCRGEKRLWTDPAPGEPPGIGDDERMHRLVVMIPPSMAAFYDSLFLSYFTVEPVSAERTRVRATVSVPEALVESGWSDLNDRVDAFTREDVEILKKVSDGTRSRSRHMGQLVEQERVIGCFHSYLRSRLLQGCS
jgi:phenylpropionate dioxygenase-like ring-hydroxylating dioxygenase large terminal subunit